GVFFDSGDKKKKDGGSKGADKKKMDGASSFNDESPILDGITKHVKNINGMISPSDATNKVHFRTLVNEERVESVDCVLPKAAAAKVKGRYENSIVGFFLGKDPSFPVVQQDQVIEKGPWMIRKSPIILSKWSPNVSLKRGEVTKVPVWVKMYNVPVLAYLEDGLSLLGTLIGKPIMLEAFTSSMCVESWGRISFAQALIEIDAAVGLKNAVIMAIPEEEGDGYIKEVVKVEYEWKPPHCVECQSFGHDTSLCPKRVREEVPKNSARETKATVMEENNDGFTEVKSRRKNKGANFGGIRLNKPKSKVMWWQKKGVDAISNSTSPGVSSNAVGDDKGMSNPGLNTSNSFDVLNADGDDMGDSGTQPKVSEFVSSDLNKNAKEACKPSSSKFVYGDGHKDKNVSCPPELNKWDVINEDDTADDEDVFTSYGASVGGGNQIEDEDCDFYEGYADQVVDLDGALKEFRDFKLSMSSRK
nr:hypothetical protein [Tanacetum cinerariifolium]